MNDLARFVVIFSACFISMLIGWVAGIYLAGGMS